MELDYRTELIPLAAQVRLAFFAAISAGLLAIVLTVVARITIYLDPGQHVFSGILIVILAICIWNDLPQSSWIRAGIIVPLFVVPVSLFLGLADSFHSPFILALFVLIGVISAAATLLAGSPFYVVLLWLLAPPLCWLVTFAATAIAGLALYVPVLALTVYLSYLLVRHYGLWAHANPQLARETRLQWLDAWYPLTDPRCKAPAESTVDTNAEERERTHFLSGLVLIPLLYAVAILAATALFPKHYAGMAAVILLAAALLIYGTISATLYQRGRVSPGMFIRSTLAAVGSWLYYNPRESNAPGLFQSPCRPRSRRAFLFSLVIVATGLVLLPATFYFPVSLATGDETTWLDAAAEPWFWEHWIADDPVSYAPNLPPRPTPEDVRTSLTPAETTYLSQLPTADARDLYLSAVADRDYRVQIHAAYAPLRERLYASPEAWLGTALRGIQQGEPHFLWALAGSFLLSTCAAVLVPALALFAIASRTLTHFHLTLEAADARYHRDEELTSWECYRQRLRESQFQTTDTKQRTIREADHVLTGVHATANYPILLHRNILKAHGHLTGDTGSGKSSLGVAYLLSQLVGVPKTSIVVIDLKGDMAVFEEARRSAEISGIPFKFFTNIPGRATFAFNPFLQTHMRELPTLQLAAVLLRSLGLEYGEGYGPSFFSSIHNNVLVATLDQYPDISSFGRLRHYLEDQKDYQIISRQDYDRSRHLSTTTGILSRLPALNVTPDTPFPSTVLPNQIDMSEVITSPSVAYFYLVAPLEEATMRTLAKLAMHSLLAAVALVEKSDHQVYLFVDEFQQVVSADLEIVLRMARAKGIGMILANQTLSDLKTRDTDLSPTVLANTHYNQVFSASDLIHQDLLMKASGEALYELGSFSSTISGHGLSETTSATEMFAPRFFRNDIIEMSDTENLSLAQVKHGFGYSQFRGHLFPMHTDFHITQREYDARSKATWPEPDEDSGTFVPPIERRPSAKPPSQPTKQKLPRESPTPNDIELTLDDPSLF